MATTQLVARDVRRSFKIGPRRIEVLRGISMDVTHGEAVFLCGASGAGKTTLLYTLAGLERPESGSVEFEGRRLYSGKRIFAGGVAQSEDGFRFPGIFFAPGIDRAGKCSVAGDDRRQTETIGRRKKVWSRSGSAIGCIICRRNCPAANSNASRSLVP